MMARETDVHLRMVIPPAPWTRAMEDGTVRAPGVSWEVMSKIDRAPERFVASQEADVGENGLRRIVLDYLAGGPPVAIPVFFTREHMQRNFLVRRDSPLQHPRDLVGKRVGSWLTIQSGTAAAVAMVLEQAYGVPIGEIDWHMGDPSTLPSNRRGLRLSPGPREEECIPALLRGEFDAIVITTGPRYWSLFGGGGHGDLETHPEVRTLGGDPADIAEVYRRTGLYVISDIVVMRPQLAVERPDVAPPLVEAFAQANQLASRYRDAAEERLAQREIELLGEDPHQYGLTPNARRNIAAYIEFFYQLGAIERTVEPEEIFVPSTCV
jgi:4,5-dihydroxyphthalate decarboxylase